jgi:hypothetical protein
MVMNLSEAARFHPRASLRTPSRSARQRWDGADTEGRSQAGLLLVFTLPKTTSG